jgi:hypothetical protein
MSLAEGTATCVCGLSAYEGYLREYGYLTERRQWLWERIAEHAGPPDPNTAREYGIWPPSPSAAQPRIRKSTSAQTLLVSLGAALLILASLVFVAVAWDLIGPIGQLSVLAAVAVMTGTTAVLVRARVPRTAEALAVVAFGMGLIVAAAAVELGTLPDSWRPGYDVLVAALAVTFGIAAGQLFGTTTWLWLGYLSTPVLVGTLLGLVGLRPEPAMTIAALAFVGLAGGLLLSSQKIDPLPARVAAAVSLTVAGLYTLALLDYSPPSGASIALAAGLLLVLLIHEVTTSRIAAWVGWPMFGVWLSLLAIHLPDGQWRAIAVAAAGVALLFLLSRWGVGIAALSAGSLWTTWVFAEDPQWPFFMVMGLGLFAFSLRRSAASLAWFGVLALEVAYLLEFEEVPFFEVPTLILAAMLLFAGLIQKRAGEQRSLVVFGPALTAALLPTSMLAWDDVWSRTALIRFAVIMLVGVVCLLLGVRLRLLGLVLPSAVAVSIAATAQLWATLDTLPRWLALALAGVALIVMGARIEWVRSQGARTSHWLRSLQ